MNSRNRTMINMRILICVFCFASAIKLTAQQEPNFTMYNFNLNIINPAYVSVNKHAEASLSYRSQWTGVPDAPNTSVIAYTAPIHDRLGFGLSVVNDEIYILNKTDASFDLAYEVQFSDEYYVHFGLKASVSFVNLNLTTAGAPDRDMVFSENESYATPTIGAGIYLSHPKYYLSLSTPSASKVERYSVAVDAPEIIVNYLHVYFGGGYIMEFNDDFSLIPAIMSRFVAGATATYDLSTTLEYQQKLKAGLNYRWKESVSIYTMFSSKSNFNFGFAYDMNVSEIAKVNTHGSLELLLRYKWN
ncbi:PorP/SprF family type IX secretion system membrane protein [Flavicella sp.]|uniref:PorP/SprF family type IX secretion system membrane protein n=1 Tax=Flavicella sp. TaxID=2957742 RepID=UPI00262C6462|nr:PorP/SprF family type IX secretion system membrane protein [Flavicella sp.]MDG1805645.1 PorP/SprF family type IX secretion system membrane protein [Flavicella sp.]